MDQTTRLLTVQVAPKCRILTLNHLWVPKFMHACLCSFCSIFFFLGGIFVDVCVGGSDKLKKTELWGVSVVSLMQWSSMTCKKENLQTCMQMQVGLMCLSFFYFWNGSVWSTLCKFCELALVWLVCFLSMHPPPSLRLLRPNPTSIIVCTA